jgi:serine protease Do
MTRLLPNVRVWLRALRRSRLRIPDTLNSTKSATFCVHLPDPNQQGFPTPRGTGFFVSPDGCFITAAHVITENGASDGPVRKDISDATLAKENELWLDPSSPPPFGASCIGISLDFVDPLTDLALLRVDRAKNSDREWLRNGAPFPNLRISTTLLDDGEEVYAFGYPLSNGGLIYPGPEVFVGNLKLSPRVTSAIVASQIEATSMVMESGPPLHYVLDKALNYGNSGGPIVATATGRVHAFCSRFQPVFVPQLHLADAKGNHPAVMIPSLYGVVVNLGHPRLVKELRQRGVPFAA